jgi:hypothetical protein
LTKASGITSMGGWLAAKEPVTLGGIGPGTGPSDIARALKAALPNLPVRVIDGYKGAADVRLAADGGELAGFCAAWEGIKLLWRKSIDSGDVSVVLQVAPKKHPELPNAPMAIDFAKTKRLGKYSNMPWKMWRLCSISIFCRPERIKKLFECCEKALWTPLEIRSFSPR